MNHLPIASGVHPEVPYYDIARYAYDGRGFLGFDLRMRLAPEELMGRSDNPLDPASASAFAQSWLFFGLLDEFSTSYKDNVHISDFIIVQTPRSLINTSQLIVYLDQWFEELRDLDRSLIRARIMRLELCLREAKVVIESCIRDDDTVSVTDQTLTLVNSIIATSLRVLGETLVWYLDKCCKALEITISDWSNDDMQGWGSSKEIEFRMIRHGWCPASVSHLQGLMKRSSSGLYYASTFEVPPSSDRVHSHCSPHFCASEAVNQDEYRTLHVESNCACTHAYASEEDIKQTIMSNCIPLLYLAQTTNEARLAQVPYDGSQQYVVISHVWSDGLGNAVENSMPLCQVTRLIRLADRIPLFAGRRVYFWIDTLCVPVRPRDVRNAAILQMYDIFAKASATVVLDRGVSATDSTRPYVEVAMQINLSKWMRRLWTLQEGVLSQSIYFLFRDALRHIDDIDAQYEAAAQETSVATPAGSFYTSLLRGQSDLDIPMADRIALIWRSIQWRKSSRRDDEALAVARMLKIDYSLLINSAPGDRMITLLHAVRQVPTGLLFLPGQRLSYPGLRWAPGTWMIGQEPDYPDPFGHKESYRFNDRQNKAQEMMALAAFQVQRGTVSPQGLHVRLPGFRLHVLDYGDPTAVWQSLLHACFFPVAVSMQRWYRLVLTPDAAAVFTDREVADDDNESSLQLSDWVDSDRASSALQNDLMIRHFELAIVCCRPRPGDRKERALLVSSSPGATGVRWLVPVHISLANELEVREHQRKIKLRPERYFWGEELPDQTEWLID